MGMKKILVIDYDQSSLASLQGILSKEGYQIVTAADGQSGWDKYNKEQPDLVLMEAMLPKVHGFELCQRITSERNSQATVFIMTGVYKDRVYRTEALRTYGAAEYFEKPLKMAELLASIAAVLGKPEAKPEARSEAGPAEACPAFAAAPAQPVRETRAEPAPAEPRRREKPRSDEDRFSLPADLDRLSRELPKVKVPAPVRHDATPEAKYQALADELLKTVVVESAVPKTPVAPKPANGNGNGNGNGRGSAEIDQFLKSALAGFDLEKEKVKAPRPAPVTEKPKPESTPPPSVAFKPKVEPPPAPAVEKPKAQAAPVPAPEIPAAAPLEPATKNTLTPGDPGSDISPFFTPGKPKPEAPVEKPKVHAAAALPVKPAPAKAAAKATEAEVIAATDLFGTFEETKTRKGLPTLVLVGIGVAALAVAGFFVLRPKNSAPKTESQQTQQAAAMANVSAPAVEEPPAPKVEPTPVKSKPQPQAKKQDPAPAGVEAIVPASVTSVALPLTAPQSGPAAGTDAAKSDAPAIKTEAPPAVKTEETSPQGSETGAGIAAAPAAAASEPASVPAAPPVREGDLIELGAATELPKLVKSVNPVYPPSAQRLGVAGSITVNALIDEKGNVIDTAILKSIQDDKGLGKSAETAVKKWKFQPARKNGVAVKVWKSFVIAFKPEGTSAA
jgi:TonB family protein